jgi:hypothetical protein
MLSVETIVGISSVGAAIISGIVVWCCLLKIKSVTCRYRLEAVCMTVAMFGIVGAMVPQLIQNHMVGSEIHKVQSPFFTALFPALVLLQFLKMDENLRAANHRGTYYATALHICGSYMLVITFIYWIFQYATYGSHSAEKALMYTVGGIYTIIIIGLSGWVAKVAIPDENSPDLTFFGLKLEEELPFLQKDPELSSEEDSEEEDTDSNMSDISM